MMNIKIRIRCNTASELLIVLDKIKRQVIEKSKYTGVNMMELEFYDADGLVERSEYGKYDVEITTV